MLKESHLHVFRTHGLLLGRVLMGGFFLIAGVSKLMDATGTAGYIASAGLPESVALAYLVGLFETLAGLALIIGRKMAEAALLLTLFTVLVSFLFHNPSVWAENQIQQTLFFKNLAIIGGLLYIVAYGKGEKQERRSNDPIPSL